MRGGLNLQGAIVRCVLLLTACATLPTDLHVEDAAKDQILAGGDRPYTQVTAGFVHTCGLDAAGAAYCWGSNEYDQLGAETSSDCGRPCSKSPVPVSGGLRFRTIAAGWVANCGVTADGATYCWGGGSFSMKGYLGDGTLRRSKTPIKVRADSAFAAVTLGDGHTCGLTASGIAYCWGRNDRGQLGDGSTIDRSTPVRVATDERFLMLSAGAYHVCGVTRAREIECWGDNRWGQLGSRDAKYDGGAKTGTPARVAGSDSFAVVASGWEHTCALTTAGVAMCWGRNDNAHQLGDGSSVSNRGIPAAVAGDQRFSAMVAGPLATCARESSNDVYCWGGNYYGALGTGESSANGVDHPVHTGGAPFTAVALGQGHACGIGVDSRLRCWGDQSAGQY